MLKSIYSYLPHSQSAKELQIRGLKFAHFQHSLRVTQLSRQLSLPTLPIPHTTTVKRHLKDSFWSSGQFSDSLRTVSGQFGMSHTALRPSLSLPLSHTSPPATEREFWRLEMLSFPLSFHIIPLIKSHQNWSYIIVSIILSHVLLSLPLSCLSLLSSLSPWQCVAVLSPGGLQSLIISYFMLLLCIIMMLSKSSRVFSPSLSQSLRWCQKSAFSENISTTITGNRESLSTQYLPIWCDHFLFYFGRGSVHCVKLLSLKFSSSLPHSPTPSPNHDLASSPSFQCLWMIILLLWPLLINILWLSLLYLWSSHRLCLLISVCGIVMYLMISLLWWALARVNQGEE